MRIPFIVGNWKMNLDRAQAVSLARGIAESIGDRSQPEVAICPPHVYLDAVGTVVASSAVSLGAQNSYHEPDGAFTGETSNSMLLDLGCQYAILGHSERRHTLGESDDVINGKIHAVIESGLMPILCVGETLQERETGKTAEVIGRQFSESLKGISADSMSQVTIAYEPVWAIGTGKVATPEQAEEIHAELRELLQNHYNPKVASTVRIQYGGSVKPENAVELLSQPNIDGALVGGASLDVSSFLAIVEAATTG